MALALRFSLAAFFVLFAVQAFAQEATIIGTVTDPTGAAVPNAPIAITNVETGLVRNTYDEQRRPVRCAGPCHIGTYSLRVSASWF